MWIKKLVAFMFILLLTVISVFSADDSTQLFESVFGNHAILDMTFHQRVLSATPGERHYRDLNNDGHPEEVWFIDLDSRHPEKYRPLLVKVIDEDGDLEFGDEPDLDSDLYIADWKADGSVNAVLDYTDIDGDNDVDEMGMYFIGGGSNYFPGKTLRVWWGRDDCDDNLLWYNVGYTYDQRLCQYRTHFGGEETFVAFALAETGKEWIPFFENPFLFYDHDGDGVAEEVLRLSGYDNEVESMRYSFDVDNDATIEQPRDFDVSLTAWAPGSNAKSEDNQRGRSSLEIPNRFMETMTLRDIPCRGYLAHEYAPHFVKPIVWDRMMLTWDEIDLNGDAQNEYSDFHERWEGVIAHGTSDFPQVGGPSCGPFNKRYELISDNTAPLQIYYHPFDNRIHLKNAQRVWMEVDWDFDRVIDMRYTLVDSDADGFIDRYEYDANADSIVDDVWDINDELIQNIEWSWADLSTIRKPYTAESLSELMALNQAIEAKIKSIDSNALINIRKALPDWNNLVNVPEFAIERLDASLESQHFLNELRRDLLIYILKNLPITNQLKEKLDVLHQHNLKIDIYKLLDINRPVANAPSEYKPTQDNPKVAWAQNWIPPNIGWESEQIAYRAYWGKFDFFGKNRPILIYPTIGSQAYHEETEWGMDALNVLDTPGCGGATLYINQKPYPLWSDGKDGVLEFTARVIQESKQQVTIEILVDNVGLKDHPYRVRMHCSLMSGRSDTVIKTRIESGNPNDELALGIGLTKLPQESVMLDTEAGVLGVRGFQIPKIGWISMGVVFPKDRYLKYVSSENENQVVLSAKANEWIAYHIQCDWLRGRRFNYSPSAADWMQQLKTLASNQSHLDFR